MPTRRAVLLAAAGAGLSAALPAWAEATRQIGGLAFGSTWRVVLPESIDSRPVRRAVETVIADVDRAMSPWRGDSDLTRFNLSRTTGWIPVPLSMSRVVAESLAVAEMTGGAFDPTVGPLVRRFGFGPITGRSGGCDKLEVRPAGLCKAAPWVTLDLCGIAKGHALDRMTAELTRLGLESALIELGGEIRNLGRHPRGRNWHAAVETPAAELGTVQRIVAPGGRALATSGHAANGYSREDRSISHIIDPQTSRPATNGVASVTVLSSTAVRADALATALAVMGEETGTAWAERHGIDALFLLHAGGSIGERMTGRFADHVVA